MDLSLIPCSNTTTPTATMSISSASQRDVDVSMKCCLVPLDRLSSLPDQLLIMILSLLPTKDVAALCMLSTRLWSVFPLITSLDFDASPISHCVQHRYGIERFPNFVSFVDSVLNRFVSDCLTRFRLVVGPDFGTQYFKSCDLEHDVCDNKCLPDLKSTQINTWISFALTRCGLRELDICIKVKNSRQRQLPTEIFTCETLEVLKLDFNLNLKKASTISFRLPKLKILEFRTSLTYKSEDGFMTRLVSSCPLLEDVTWESHWNHSRFIRLVSSSLRRLCFRMHNGFTVAKTKLVHIDTPNLEHFEYFDNLAIEYSIPVMKCLIKANITTSNDHLILEEFEPHCEKMLSLIRPLCNVQRLSLRGSYLKDLDFPGINDQLPLFHNLKHLELGRNGFSYWGKVLLAFFHCSPVLETLVFPEGLIVGDLEIKGYYIMAQKHWEKKEFCGAISTSLPGCSNLKRIEIKNYFGKRELELIGFMLRHGFVLEEFIVWESENIESFSDQIVLGTISHFPRASVKCNVQVL